MTTKQGSTWLHSVLMASVAAWTVLLMAAPIDDGAPAREAAKASAATPHIAQVPYVSASELVPSLIDAPLPPHEELPPTF